MISKVALSSILAVAIVLARPAEAAPRPILERSTPALSLTAQLRLADIAAERYQLLPKDEDFVFDFNKNQFPLANPKSFPALVGSGASFSLSQLPGMITTTSFALLDTDNRPTRCSMSFVHLHPRATELFAITSGRVLSEMVPEAGVLDSNGKQRVIRNELSQGMLTIYPAGSFHTQVNPDCEPAQFTAAFTSEDFGISLVVDQTFAFSEDVIAATIGQSIAGEDIDKVRHAIPGNVLIKVEECLSKCGKQKRQV